MRLADQLIRPSLKPPCNPTARKPSRSLADQLIRPSLKPQPQAAGRLRIRRLADQLIRPSLKLPCLFLSARASPPSGGSIDPPFIEACHAPTLSGHIGWSGGSIDPPFIEAAQDPRRRNSRTGRLADQLIRPSLKLMAITVEERKDLRLADQLIRPSLKRNWRGGALCARCVWRIN